MLTRQFIQSVLGLFFLVSSSFALSNTEFTYNVIDGGIELTGCADGCPSDLVIPEEIDGNSVVSIGDDAFYEKQLASVVIPDSVIAIGEWAFSMNQLTTVEIPNSVVEINKYAFSSNQLASVTIPENLLAIERAIFLYNELNSIIIPNSVESIGEMAFSHNNLTMVTIPNSVTVIKENAFRYNYLKAIIIPESVTHIEDSAFISNDLVWLGFMGETPVIMDTSFDNNELTTITYCQNTNGGWDSVVIEGITPQFDENCFSSTTEYSVLDIDQSGSVDALTDCLILLRYFFGLRGDNLINGAIATDANRTSASEIEAHIQSLLP